jgi:uncharacterized phage protein (TIGR01671 family)
MGREIKFQAVINSSIHGKGVFPVININFIPLVIKVNVNGEAINFFEGEVILREFTGLKDKNDREIYEGDIVEERWPNPLTGGENVDHYKIKFNESIGLYKMLHSSGEERWHRVLFLRFKEVKVIGNIYENPELLAGES